MTDPHTGQTVCSCQYSSALLSSYSRLPHSLGAPPSSLFGPGGAGGAYSAAAAAAAAGSAQAPYMPLGAEGSAFYTPLGANGSNIRDGSDAWRSLGQPSLYDTSAMGFYPYGTGYGGLDLNARRKNATRESTNTLKAWLQEHIKNPYPTKGEKIMLAIITKMTLTQVSTWFANARRRLKKENKMTWSPRNRSEDGDDDDDDDNSECGEDKKSHNNNNNSNSDNNHKDRCRDEHIDVGTESGSKSGDGHRRDEKNQCEREISHCRLSPELPRGPAHIAGEPIQPPAPHSGTGDLLLDGGKPKIWSVSDFLGSAPHKDALGLGYPHKLDPLKPDLHPGMLGGQAGALIGRSPAHAHNGFSSLHGSAHHISAYPSSLGYSAGPYPYSLSSYGGGKFLSPVATSVAPTRFNPFPPVKPLSMNSPYTGRRDIGMAREGE